MTPHNELNFADRHHNVLHNCCDLENGAPHTERAWSKLRELKGPGQQQEINKMLTSGYYHHNTAEITIQWPHFHALLPYHWFCAQRTFKYRQCSQPHPKT